MSKAKINLGLQNQNRKTEPTKWRVRIIIGLILVAFLFLGSLSMPQYWNNAAGYIRDNTPINVPDYYNVPFHLGLDLQGGTHLVYEADLTTIPEEIHEEAIEGVRDVIERRVNAFGVAEPKIQTTKSGDTWRVIVELAGISDVREAIAMIGETPILEFKEQNLAEALADDAPEWDLVTEANIEELAYAKEIRAKAVAGENFEDLVMTYSESVDSIAVGGDTGWVTGTSFYGPIIEQLGYVYSGMILPEVYELGSEYYILKAEEAQRDGKELNISHILVCYEGASRCSDPVPELEASTEINSIKEEINAGNFLELAVEHSDDPSVSYNNGSLGWVARGQMVEAFETAAFNLPVGQISEVIQTEFGYHLIYKSEERSVREYHFREVVLPRTSIDDIVYTGEWVNTDLSGKNLESSHVEFNPNTGVPYVTLQFNSEGDKLFSEITERNIGRPVAIFLDGQAISVPTVQQAIYGGQAIITGDFTVDEAKLLAQRLNAGALPVPIDLISQQTVGPSLGQISLQKSLIAGLIGFLLIALFMIGYYRLPGLLSVFALLMYGAIVLAIFKLLPVTLTLAGLAGFVLSVGIAVDANVLIFERLREELRTGRPFSSAIDEGFRRAWTSIRDGNVTTLLACLILYWFSSSFIQGFALTLGIGILASMFTAIVVTRILLKWFAGWKWVRNKWLFGIRNS